MSRERYDVGLSAGSPDHLRSSAGRLRGSETLRWLLTLALSAIVSYFTALGALREEVATVKATEQNHFEEVLRSLQEIKADVRELRSRSQ